MNFCTFFKQATFLVALLAFLQTDLQAQNHDPAALQQQIAEMESLMSRTDPSHAEYQKAAAIRTDLQRQLTQSTPDGRLSPYSPADMQQYIVLMQNLMLLLPNSANNDYAIQYTALINKRPKFDSLAAEQAVMVLQLEPAKYDIWKQFQTMHPNYYN